MVVAIGDDAFALGEAVGGDPGERLVDGTAGDAVDHEDAALGAGDEFDLNGRVDGDGRGVILAGDEFAGKFGLGHGGLVDLAQHLFYFRAAALAPGGSELAAEAEFLFGHAG